MELFTSCSMVLYYLGLAVTQIHEGNYKVELIYTVYIYNTVDAILLK